MADSDQSTRALAESAGVELSWRDMGGEEHAVSIETLRAVVEALQGPAGDGEPRANFVTARVGQPVAIPGLGDASASYEVSFEDGERRVVSPMEGREGGATLPPFDRPGYHRVHLASGEIIVATAPQRCLSMRDVNDGRRGWGIAAQIYSLGSGAECGVGDFGGVAELARASAKLGADLLAVSPAHATLGVPERFNSPYSASSRLFFNPVYADPTLALPASLANAAMNEAGVGAERCPRRDLVDWPAAQRAKSSLLKSAYALLARSGSPLHAEFAEFAANASGALKNHALFEAIRAEAPLHWDWRNWPEGFRSPAGAAAQAFARDNPEAVSFQIFLQWLTGRSCAAAQAQAKQAGMSVGLIADVAAGLDPAGSDAWARQGEVLRGLTLGAPPDFFTPAGQDWRLTTFSPHGLAATGFAPFIETLRACLEHVGGLRIDHIMGMQRLWLIPEGMGPRQGAYVRFPAETLFRLVALESWRRRAIVIGEDLGTLPHHFQGYVAQQGVIGMRLLRIERDAHAWKPPSQWDSAAAALTATHDIIATAGWWKGVDIGADAKQQESRARDRKLLWDAFCKASVAKGDPPTPQRAPEAVDAAFGFIAKTPCEIRLVTLEDVLATDIQPNVPGTTVEKPNWRHRYTQGAEDLLSAPDVVSRLGKLGSPRSARET